MKRGIKFIGACVLGAVLASGVYFGGMALAADAAAPAAADKAQVAAPAANTEKAPVAAPAADKDVMATLAADAQFSKFVELVKTAKVEDALKTAPCTVFAPTDAAFASMTKEQADALKDAAKAKAAVLDLVAPKAMKAEEIAKAKEIKTLGGNVLVVKDSTVGGAKIVKSDIAAKNGMIQATDKIAAAAAPVAPAVEKAPAAAPTK